MDGCKFVDQNYYTRNEDENSCFLYIYINDHIHDDTEETTNKGIQSHTIAISKNSNHIGINNEEILKCCYVKNKEVIFFL